MSSEIQDLKCKLNNNKITVGDLSSEEVRILTQVYKIDLNGKNKELDDLNQKIKNIKYKIDNWNKK